MALERIVRRQLFLYFRIYGINGIFMVGRIHRVTPRHVDDLDDRNPRMKDAGKTRDSPVGLTAARRSSKMKGLCFVSPRSWRERRECTFVSHNCAAKRDKPLALAYLFSVYLYARKKSILSHRARDSNYFSSDDTPF